MSKSVAIEIAEQDDKRKGMQQQLSTLSLKAWI